MRLFTNFICMVDTLHNSVLLCHFFPTLCSVTFGSLKLAMVGVCMQYKWATTTNQDFLFYSVDHLELRK